MLHQRLGVSLVRFNASSLLGWAKTKNIRFSYFIAKPGCEGNLRANNNKPHTVFPGEIHQSCIVVNRNIDTFTPVGFNTGIARSYV